MATLITRQDYQRALEDGLRALQDPYATYARFNQKSHVLAITYSNGMTVSFDIRKSPMLSQHQGADLSDPYITPGGDGLLFEKAGLSFATIGLVAPFLPESLARQKIDSVIGKVCSSGKARASRANGTRGYLYSVFDELSQDLPGCLIAFHRKAVCFLAKRHCCKC